MKKNFWAFFFVLSFFIFSITAHASYVPYLQKSIFSSLLEPFWNILGYRELKIYVFDQETELPLENAVVMVGDTALAAPHEQNWVTTDKNGNASFDHAFLPQGPLTLTVGHPDYSRYTVFQSKTTELYIPLVPLKNQIAKNILSGSLTQWPQMQDHDGVAHIGFFIPSLDILSWLDLTGDKFLAPNVKAFLYKQTELPGNIVIPEQEENYWGFISIYMSKPTYEMPLISKKFYDMVVLSGQLPFDKFASDYLNKKPLVSLINLVSIDQFNLVTDFLMPDSKTTLDIPLSHYLQSKFTVSSPHTPQNRDLIYISTGTFKNKPTQFFPMDFKMNSRKDKQKIGNLKSLPSHTSFAPFQETIFTLAVDLPSNSSDKRPLDSALMGIIQRPAFSDTHITLGSFLNPMHISFVPDQKRFSYDLRPSSSIKALAPMIPSHMHLSFINIAQEGKSRPWWIVMGPSSMSEFTLPKLPYDLSEFPKLPIGSELKWIFNSLGFNESNTTFDYDNFSIYQLSQGLSHFSQNRMKLNL